MKKILFLFLCLFLTVTTVNASSIDEISMDIILDEEGNATITEKWSAYPNQGTEAWHPYYNLADSEIEVIGASMDGKEYTVESYWNESASLSGKAYKAGIYKPTSDETDIVFGITDYGYHNYEVVYTISNFVKSATDADIIYWQLFPYDFSAAPGNVKIKISGPYVYPDTLDVWGYGMYGAPCYVKDGAIYMTSDGRIGSSEYLTLLAKFPKGTFSTMSQLDHDFDHYLNMANEGAEVYKGDELDKTSLIFALITVLFQIGVWLIVIIAIAKSTTKNNINYTFGEKGNKLPKDKDINNFRDIPCNKDIYRAFWVADTYKLNKNKNDFLGVLLLKWVKNGNVLIETIDDKGFFKDKKQDVITFVKEPENINEHEKNLYRYMLEASGDGKLEKDEFKKWCKKHYSKILGITDKMLKYERDELIKEHSVVDQVTDKGLVFKYQKHTYLVRDNMYDEAIQMKGLKKFLNEFSQIDKKEPIEVHMWDEYLMYAQIFGIADKVMERFKKLYPEIMDEMQNYNFDYGTFVFINSISTTGVSAASAARSAAQSYSGGGGGFSSGGGGGGSFGGGGGGGGFR